MTTGTREWHETTPPDTAAPALRCDWDDEEDDDPDDEEDDEDADEEDNEEPGWYVSRRPTPSSDNQPRPA